MRLSASRQRPTASNHPLGCPSHNLNCILLMFLVGIAIRNVGGSLLHRVHGYSIYYIIPVTTGYLRRNKIGKRLSVSNRQLARDYSRSSSSSSSSSSRRRFAAYLTGTTKTVISSMEADPPSASFHLQPSTDCPRAAQTSSWATSVYLEAITNSPRAHYFDSSLL